MQQLWNEWLQSPHTTTHSSCLFSPWHLRQASIKTAYVDVLWNSWAWRFWQNVELRCQVLTHNLDPTYCTCVTLHIPAPHSHGIPFLQRERFVQFLTTTSRFSHYCDLATYQLSMIALYHSQLTNGWLVINVAIFSSEYNILHLAQERVNSRFLYISVVTTSISPAWNFLMLPLFSDTKC